MKVNIKTDCEQDNTDPLVVGATLNCTPSELLIISAALYDMGQSQKRHECDKKTALKLKQSIIDAFN